jgi:hypothetical protein
VSGHGKYIYIQLTSHSHPYSLHQIANIQRLAILQRNVRGLKEPILTPEQHIIRLDKVKIRTSGTSGGWSVVNIVLLKDRMILLRERRLGDRQMEIQASKT